jgi:hypothetical protein
MGFYYGIFNGLKVLTRKLDGVRRPARFSLLIRLISLDLFQAGGTIEIREDNTYA